MDEVIKEFLIESNEYLDQLDSDLVELEKKTYDQELLARVFRAFHTIKGTSGFLSYMKLEALTHEGEGLLTQIRDGVKAPNAKIISALLALVDAIRNIMTHIEASEQEGDEAYSDLVETLSRLQEQTEAPAEAPIETAHEEPAITDPPTSGEISSQRRVEPKDRPPAPPVSGKKLSSREKTLVLLGRLHLDFGQPISLTALASARGIAAGTVRNQLTQLKKDGLVNLFGDNTYEPASGAAVDPVTPSEERAPEPAVERAPEPAVEGAPEPAVEGASEPAVETIPMNQEIPTAPPTDTETARKIPLADNTIRVNVELLDKLMNLVGELVLTRNQIVQFSSDKDDSELNTSSQHLNLITTELQEGVMKTRMQPIGNIWNKLPRVVRDIAVTCGKQARVEMEGEDTELDKTIIEAIKDPLTHLVRNAVDHGIETPEERQARGKPQEGRLFLRAFHEGGQVNIEISDDGAGIDPAKVKEKAIKNGLVSAQELARLSDRELLHLIFLPGFSMAEKVSNISGRGVGMDVVKTNIEKIGGTVDIQSKLGEGTTFKLKIPLTLAIIPALLVTTSGDRYAIPQINLLELVRLEGEQIRTDIEMIHETPVYRLRGTLLPLVYLDQLLELGARTSANGQEMEAINIVVLQADDQKFGLVVDEIIDTEEIVVKPLSKQLKHLSAYSGATIMGDGRVSLILDILGIAQRSGVLSDAGRARTLAEAEAKAQQKNQADVQTLLLLKSGFDRRLAIPLSVVSRLEEVACNMLEGAHGQEVVQYRGHILPLIRLSQVLGDGMGNAHEEVLQVVVCSHKGATVGLVVDEIVDIVEERVAVQRRQTRDHIEGIAVVQEHVIELLDVDRIISNADISVLEEQAA